MKLMNIMIYGMIGIAYLLTRNKIGFIPWIKKGHLELLTMILIFMNSLSLLVGISQAKENASILVRRDNYGGKEQQIELVLSENDEVSNMVLEVSPVTYSSKEARELLQKAMDELVKQLKGDNKDLQHIREDLSLEYDYGKYPFDLEVASTNYKIVNDEGLVSNSKKNLEELGYTKKDWEAGIPVVVTLTFWYGELNYQQQVPIWVMIREYSDSQQNLLQVQGEIEKNEEKNNSKKTLEIPTKIDGVNIERLDGKAINGIHVMLLGIVVVILLVFRDFENYKTIEKQRIDNLKRSYPWFVNELVLLLGAGMQVKNIFALLVHTYGGKNQHKELMELIEIAYQRMNMGEPEGQVYHKMGKEIKVSSYLKLMTLLEQNVRTGAKGLLELLEQEEVYVLEERKNHAKTLGEEAGTKMLGPMILLLAIIMLIIMIPALMSF